MPDGIAEAGGGEPSDRLASDGDAGLIRDVRLRLVAWSGLTTLLVLAILGIALYLSAARTLADNGVSQLNLRASQIVDTLEHPNGRPGGPEYGFIFGGGQRGKRRQVDDHRPLGPEVAAGVGHRRGTLAPGRDADLVAWEVDPEAERGSGNAFRAGRAVLTVVGGEVMMQV